MSVWPIGPPAAGERVNDDILTGLFLLFSPCGFLLAFSLCQICTGKAELYVLKKFPVMLKDQILSFVSLLRNKKKIPPNAIKNKTNKKSSFLGTG
jgi:hypothetical protein